MDDETLMNVGLSKNEAKVYKSLVKLKRASIQEIYRDSLVPRVNIYDVLESLRGKGLVGSITRSNKMYFEPAHPKNLKELLKKKEKDLKRTDEEIRRLEQEFSLFPIKKDVLFFDGKLGIKNVLNDCLNSTTEIINFASGRFPTAFPDLFNHWESDRVKRKIPMRMITSRAFRNKLPKIRLQKIRYIDRDFKNKSSMFIYDNKVAVFLWLDNPMSILIENEAFADSMRNFFESLWDSSG